MVVHKSMFFFMVLVYTWLQKWNSKCAFCSRAYRLQWDSVAAAARALVGDDDGRKAAPLWVQRPRARPTWWRSPSSGVSARWVSFCSRAIWSSWSSTQRFARCCALSSPSPTPLAVPTVSACAALFTDAWFNSIWSQFLSIWSPATCCTRAVFKEDETMCCRNTRTLYY